MSIVLNLISFIISFEALAGLLFLLFRYLINKFNHLD